MSHEPESSNRGFKSRPEAKPFTWDELTEDQRKTVADIHAWLLDYVASKPETPDEQASPLGWSIDRDRPSNVLLIDGGRGSGKTSVLLSMLDLWNRRLGADADKLLEHWEKLHTELKALEGSLIPVRALDLQSLPRSSSLRTWIAGRILTLAETLAPTPQKQKEGQTEAQRSMVFSSGKEPAWKTAWRDLLQDAAASSQDGGSRRNQLDPETFAVELEQAELARLTINDHWRKFVDAVIEGVTNSPKIPGIQKDARIILSIDDADMNPERCVELLELVRNLWHPRIVFLLTGHSALFMKLLTLHFQNVFRAQLGPHALTDFERSLIERQEPTPDELAYQAYDKVLPPPQRFAIRPLVPEERMQLFEDELKVGLQKQESSGPPVTLREHFALNPYVRPALPDRLRRVQGLKQAWNRLQSRGRSAAAFVRELWRDALSDESYRLSPADASQIQGWVGLEGEHIRLQPLPRRFQRLTDRTKHFQLQGETWLLEFAESAGFAYPVSGGDVDRFLPPRLTAALLLAVDLFLEELTGSFDSLSPMTGGFDHDLVRHELNPTFEHNQNFGVAATQKSIATWPLPDWRVPLDFAIFSEHWNDALRRSSGSSEQRLEFIACAFLWAVIAAHRRDVQLKPALTAGRPDWDELADTLVEFSRDLDSKPHPSERDERFLYWTLGRAILLAAPESGLPADIANKLLTAWIVHLAQVDASLRGRAFEAARLERQSQAARMNHRAGPASDFLTRIDSSLPQYHWAQEIEMQGKARALSMQNALSGVLSSFDVRQKDPALSDTRRLSDYFQKLQVDISITPHDAKRAHEALDKFRKAGQGTPEALIWLWKNVVTALRPDVPGLRTLLNRAFGPDKLMFQLPVWMGVQPGTHERVQARVKQVIALDDQGTELQLYGLTSPSELDEVSQFVMVAHDVIWDMNDYIPDWLGKSKIDGDQFMALPHAEIVHRFRKETFRVGWPAPRWATFLDFKLESQGLVRALDQLLEGLGHGKDSEHSRLVLATSMYAALSISAGIGEMRSANPPLPLLEQDFVHWHQMGARLRRLYAPDDTSNLPSNRRKLLINWAQRAAPLYATPEMGLPHEFAKGLLTGWMGVPPQFKDAPLRRVKNGKDYRQLRLNWLNWLNPGRTALFKDNVETLKDAKDASEKARQFIEDMDSQDPDHPWIQVFGPQSSTSDEDA